MHSPSICRSVPSVLLVLCVLTACTTRKNYNTTAKDRQALAQLIDLAVRDSVRFRDAHFDFPASMQLSITSGDSTVVVTDSFRLVKMDTSTIQTIPISHSVTGDTTLLKDMYTFRTSQGVNRGATQGQLAGLNFGVSPLTTLYVLARDTVSASYEITENAMTNTGRGTSVRYETNDGSGEFVFAPYGDYLASVKSTTSNSRDYVVGSYDYHITTYYSTFAFDSAPIPTWAEATFAYKRLFSNGSGKMKVNVYHRELFVDSVAKSF